MNKKRKERKPLARHIELRKDAGWNKNVGVIDLLVLVETRTGMTLRWSENSEWGRRSLEKEL